MHPSGNKEPHAALDHQTITAAKSIPVNRSPSPEMSVIIIIRWRGESLDRDEAQPPTFQVSGKEASNEELGVCTHVRN